MPAPSDIIRFTTHAQLRHRIVLSILSGRSIRIDSIRPADVHVGLRDCEISFLRLIEKITNGTTIEISVTGTSFLLHPGVLSGGSYTHSCHLSRSIGYYLEPLVALAPWGKKPLYLTLEGITNRDGDITVDTLRTVTLPHLAYFSITDAELNIKKRGAAPLGGGLITFKCPVVRQLPTIDLINPPKISKIRGVAWSTRVSPSFANRMVDSARAILNRFVPDVYLYTDVYKGDDSGRSPGYGITIVTHPTPHTAERVSTPGVTPEDLALEAVRQLLATLDTGCVDAGHQWLMLLFMTLSKEDVARCQLGHLSEHSVSYLRTLESFFQIRFKLDSRDGLIASCVGTGYSNVNKSVA